MRVYNFSAGPSTLPVHVLEEAQKELLDFAGTGMSVTEISHRDKAFSAIVEEAESLVRELLGVRPVAAHRDYFPLAAHGAHERRKRGRALALEEYVRARQGGG